MRRPILPLLAGLLVLVGAGPRPAAAASMGTYRFDPGGTVRGVRIVDLDGDGRKDLVILLEDPETGVDALLLARTPEVPVRKTFFGPAHLTRIPCTGALATAGAVSVGRFGPKGAGRVRFLGPTGILQVGADGRIESATQRLRLPTLFARSAGQDLVFWDGVADLDGNGRDDLWVPLAAGNGPIHLVADDPKHDRTLAVSANNIGASSDVLLLSRHAYVPNLFPADLDGDGVQELVALQGEDLVGWDVHAASDSSEPRAPSFRLHLPFLEPDPSRAPTQMFVPRLQVQDVDGDRTADLLVTLLTGEHGKIASLRTTLYHYPGPFRDEASGQLVAPKARIDTASCVLHPLFVDVDRDRALDYVGDAMHGSQTELFARMLGKEPTMVFVGFRFDKQRGSFETAPAFETERPYASSETLSNRFGRSAWFSGDFDGDGHGDLLDLGNLKGVEILRGSSTRQGGGTVFTWTPGLLPRIPVPDGLAADARLGDLDADGRTDAVLWGTDVVYLVVPKGAK